MNPSKEYLQKWRKSAEGAFKNTSKKWSFYSAQGELRFVYHGDHENKRICVLPSYPDSKIEWIVGEHIANACPQNFLLLINIVESQEKELEQVKKDLNWYRDKCNYLENKIKELENSIAKAENPF